MLKLDPKAFGLSLGIVWSVCAFLLGVLSMCCDWGTGLVNAFSSLYIGYEATLTGSLIGAVWAFFDAAIGGIVIAWLYNKLAK